MEGTVAEAGTVKRSVRIAGHATSVSLEAAFWQALHEIARRRGVSPGQLIGAIDRDRSGALSSAIRLFVLECCRRGELPPTTRAAPPAAVRENAPAAPSWRPQATAGRRRARARR